MTGSGDTSPTPDDVVARAKAALESEVWCWTGPQTPEIVRGLVAEIERLREGLARIERFSRLQALSDRARTGPAAAGYHSDERYWLDLLAIIERVGVES